MTTKSLARWLPSLLTAVILVGIIGVSYILQLNRTVSANILQNITELAAHDKSYIQDNVEATWTLLGHVGDKLRDENCQTMEELESWMNLECANSNFAHLYIVAADGKVYTDKFVTYDPTRDDQNGRIDLLPLFAGGQQRIVTRYDDNVVNAGLTKEFLLYGIRLSAFQVDGIDLVALVGINDISSIQDSMTISSFQKDGISRGYSAVIDSAGNYIVNVDRTVFLNDNDSFFSRIDGSQRTELTSDQIAQKMAAGETFYFYHTNSQGIQRIVYCTPFGESGIEWYFLSSVETVVFNEQNRAFLTMSMAMLAGVVIVVLGLLLLVLSSQRKAITANAEAAAQSAFLANMSHEIRTPLNGIIGLLYLLEKDLEKVPAHTHVRQRVDKARSTAEYLLSLINNILDITKLQAGKVTLNQEPISPERIAEDLWAMQKANMDSRGITFRLETEITQPWIMGDDLRLKQVLMNILGNAAKFTPAGGRVVLSVRQSDPVNGRVTTTFQCSDNGCGMSPEFQEHIWDSFSQEQGSSSQSVKGTGLGMAISKRLVDAMGGEIQVESTQGVGSTFYVVLHSQVAQAPQVAEQPAEQPGKPMRVLLAEDNELNAEILQEILESEGILVTRVADGQAALETFRASQEGAFQAILMDMQMPVMDGCTAAAEIRKLDRADAGTVAIFACTANTFMEDRERAEASGMTDFLTKPVDVSELMKKLSSCAAVPMPPERGATT